MIKDGVTVKIYLHPLAWRVVQRVGQYDERWKAYDCQKTMLYKLIVTNLKRSKFIKEELSQTPPKLNRPGLVFISKRDMATHGFQLPMQSQIEISKLLVMYERDKLCREIATAKVFGGIGTNTMIQHLILKYLYEDDEISASTLKKHYQRHGKEYEEELYIDLDKLKINKISN